MANHKSAKKRVRQALKRTFYNKSRLTRARTAIKALRTAISQGEKSHLQDQLRKAQSLLARTNLSSRAIARKTSRLARAVFKNS